MLPVESPRTDEELDLRAYLAVIAKRWKVIFGVALVAVVAAVLYVVQQDASYKAEAELLVRQSESATIIGDQVVNANEAARQLNNEVKLFESGTMQEAVEAAYDGPLDPQDVRASTTSDSSDVLSAHVTAADPDAAADLVNLYAETFIQVRRQQRTDELLAVGENIQQKIAELDAQIAQVDEEDAAPLLNQRSFYQSQLEDVELSAEITQTSGAQILTVAEAPESPVTPRPVRDVGVALIVGLVLGVGLAFLVDSLDDRIRDVADLDRISGGLPTMALVPLVEKGHTERFIATRDEVGSAQAEAFRSLRTAVKFAGLDRPLKTIQVTSAAQGEGKTTTVSNLAIAFAQGGERVAIACCDLRRPNVQERFDLTLSPGLTDVLARDVTLDQAVRRYAANLGILPAGTPARNPSELLSTDRAAAVVEALSEQTEVVLVDTPPVLPVTDALVVSRMVEGTLVVVDAGRTTRKDVRRTLQLLRQVNAPVIGLVLNGVAPGDQYTYGYGSAYDHPRDAANGAHSRRGRRVRV